MILLAACIVGWALFVASLISDRRHRRRSAARAAEIRTIAPGVQIASRYGTLANTSGRPSDDFPGCVE
jgi:hypothetical protein